MNWSLFYKEFAKSSTTQQCIIKLSSIDCEKQVSHYGLKSSIRENHYSSVAEIDVCDVGYIIKQFENISSFCNTWQIT